MGKFLATNTTNSVLNNLEEIKVFPIITKWTMTSFNFLKIGQNFKILSEIYLPLPGNVLNRIKPCPYCELISGNSEK